MKYLETQNIPVEDIDASDRLRPLNIDWVLALRESIQKIGLKEPIEVVATLRGPKKYRLIAGGHRLEAHIQANLDEIRAEIKEPQTADFDNECRLHEIDENLIRNELNPLDRAVFLGERQRIYEAMYPESKNGANGGPGGWKNENEIISFSLSTAEAIGLGQRTIQRATLIYKSLDADIRAKIQGTPLAGKEGELYKLTRYSPEHQAIIIEACTRADNPAPSVSVAAQELDGRPAQERDPDQAAIDHLTQRWRQASKTTKSGFLDLLCDIGVIDAYDPEQLA